MDQQNNTLVAQILATAAEECERVKAQADLYVKEMQERAEREEQSFLEERETLANQEAAEYVRRKETLAALDAKKYVLGVKQEIVDGIYRRAVGRLSGMSESQYLSFLDQVISRYAEADDTVVFAQNCSIDRAKLAALPSVKQRNLAISFDGKFGGGVLLAGKTCDKEFTFASVCEGVREETEAELSKTLFGAK